MMNTSINKSNFIIIILIIFTLSFSVFFYFTYTHEKESFDKTNIVLNKNINNLYNQTSNQILKNSLKNNANRVYNYVDIEKLKKSINTNNKADLIKLIKPYEISIKKDIPTFSNIHIISSTGKSILSMDSLKQFKEIVPFYKNILHDKTVLPTKNFYYEVKKEKLLYRYITPIYDESYDLVCFLELSMSPRVILKELNLAYALTGYLFINDNSKYKLCSNCSVEDAFIKGIRPKLNFDADIYRIEHKDKYYDILTQKIDDNDGNTIAQFLFFKDITEAYKNMDMLIYKGLGIFLLCFFLIYFIFNIYIEKLLFILNRSKFILNNINDFIIVINPIDGKIIYVNHTTNQLLGYGKNELIGQHISKIKYILKNEKIVSWEEKVEELKKYNSLTHQTNSIKKNKTIIPVESSMTYMKDGNNEYIVSVGRDITEQLKNRKKLKQDYYEINRLSDLISESVLYTTADLDGNITSVSKSFMKHTGFSKEDIIGHNHNILRHPDMSSTYYEEMWETLKENKQFKGNIKNRKKDGSTFWIKVTIDPLFNEYNEKIGYAAYREDITDKKELEYISTHDQLTKLYNRYELNSYLKTKIKTARRYDIAFGYIMFDIDHFKYINDTYGHHIGDLVLVKLSDTIKTLLREDDMVARWGGEEFVIVTVQSNEEELKQLAQKIKDKIATLSFDPVEKVTISFGLTVYKENDDEKSIEKRADNALYLAKNNGRDRYEIL